MRWVKALRRARRQRQQAVHEAARACGEGGDAMEGGHLLVVRLASLSTTVPSDVAPKNEITRTVRVWFAFPGARRAAGGGGAGVMFRFFVAAERAIKQRSYFADVTVTACLVLK